MFEPKTLKNFELFKHYSPKPITCKSLCVWGVQHFWPMSLPKEWYLCGFFLLIFSFFRSELTECLNQKERERLVSVSIVSNKEDVFVLLSDGHCSHRCPPRTIVPCISQVSPPATPSVVLPAPSYSPSQKQATKSKSISWKAFLQKAFTVLSPLSWKGRTHLVAICCVTQGIWNYCASVYLLNPATSPS